MTKRYLIEVDLKTLKLFYKMVDIVNKHNTNIPTIDIIEVLNNAELIDNKTFLHMGNIQSVKEIEDRYNDPEYVRLYGA